MTYTRDKCIRGAPDSRVQKYAMGTHKDDRTHLVELLPEMTLQIQGMALESARIAAGKKLTTELQDRCLLELKCHPHNVLRENKMISGAHPDRLQEGMRRAFRKPLGRAARAQSEQPLFSVRLHEQEVNPAREALTLTSKKLPKSYSVGISAIAAQRHADGQTASLGFLPAFKEYKRVSSADLRSRWMQIVDQQEEAFHSLVRGELQGRHIPSGRQSGESG